MITMKLTVEVNVDCPKDAVNEIRERLAEAVHAAAGTILSDEGYDYTVGAVAIAAKDRKANKHLRDKDGYRYAIDSKTNFAYRITECCRDAVTIDQDTGNAYCKGCYHRVDYRLVLSPAI